MFFLIAFSNCVAEFHIKIAIKRLLLASNKLYMYFQWLTMLLNQEVRAKKFYIIYNNVTEHDKVVEEVTGKVNFDGLVLDSSFFKWVVNTCHIVLHLYNCIILALYSSQLLHIFLMKSWLSIIFGGRTIFKVILHYCRFVALYEFGNLSESGDGAGVPQFISCKSVFFHIRMLWITCLAGIKIWVT